MSTQSDQPLGPSAASLVNGPATGLIVTAGLGMVLQAAGILMNMLGVGIGAAGAEDAPDLVGQLAGGTISIVSGVIGVAICIVILLGAIKMKKLESYGFALAAAILAILPCQPCCLLGIPIGIWALIVLNKPEVKSAFS